MRYILFFLFCLTLGIQNAGAATYYVSNSGDDSNDGLSPGNAFETLQHAADEVSTGDTVLVENGTYAGFDIRNVNGTSTDPIVFMAAGNNVLINTSGPIRDDGINVENADYIVIDGFIVNGMTGSGNGIRVVLSDFCVVRNCSCSGNAERGIFTGFTDDITIEFNTCTNSVDEHGIYVSNSSDRPVIRYNECYGNNNIGIHMNGDLSAGEDGIIHDPQVYGNVLHDNNLAAGINMDGVTNALVYNNLIYNNHSAQGIALFQQDGAVPSSGALIYNNTIIVPSDGRWGILVRDGCNVNTQIFNNIIINQHAWRGSITIEDDTDFSSDYNILINSLSDSGDGSSISLEDWQALGFDTHSELADPLGDIFVNPGSGDYHLMSTSQAVNAGTSAVSGVVSDDLDGIARPVGAAYDIGCYESELVLAVHIVDPLRAVFVDRQVLLQWSVSGPEIGDIFEIQRSFDLQNWELLGTITERNTVQGIRSYEFADVLPFLGRAYYRVVHRTADNASGEIGITSILVDDNPVRLFSPNPTAGHLEMLAWGISETIIRLDIYTARGELVRTESEPGRVVDVSGLTVGAYVLVASFDNGKTVSEKLIISR